jgi:Winged helix-turn-helix DNA-binding
MLTPRTSLTRRVMAALDASPSRIPVLVGGCGSGRTTLLHQLRDRVGRSAAQYIDVERTATTPERFMRASIGSSPFPSGVRSSQQPAADSAPAAQMQPAPAEGPRSAFDVLLAFLSTTRGAGGEPSTFLLDEFLELRTFESFPGLRRVLHDLVDRLGASDNRFVLTSRYIARTLRLLRDRSARFELIPMPAFTVEDTADLLGGSGPAHAADAEYVAGTVHALGNGCPAYVRALTEELVLEQRSSGGPPDPISALVALLGPEGRLAKHCNFCYELRLHRARGYGALKAILEILAEDEGLTLTEISQRLQRTPGSTKDYLSWLEDVDLVTARQKRYSYTDPLLRVWVRLHCRPTAPTEDDVAREVHAYALPRLPAQQPQPQAEAAFAMATAGSGSGIIEID